MSNDLNKTLTQIVVSEINSQSSKKSTGTKIATVKRDIPIIIVKPFSL